MNLLLSLILAHLLGDFVLQSKTWIEDKEKKKAGSFKLYLHALIHALLIFTLTRNISFWPFILTIMISHLLIDMGKLYFQTEKTKRHWFFIDQIAHFLVIIVVWYSWERPTLIILKTFETQLLIYIIAVIFLSFVASVIIKVILTYWTLIIADEKNQSLMSAGKFIGILERLLVFIFVITFHWEAIGFLIAAKSVFRFGNLKETKDRNLTEYVLIGTMLSFGIAIITGLITLQIQSLI